MKTRAPNSMADPPAFKDLGEGDLLPRILVPPPGPASKAVFAALARWEAPSVNTLVGIEGSLAWAEARGANVLDPDGNIFIDLTSGFGVAAIGHCHPRVVAAVRRQAALLLHGLGDVHGHALRAHLAERLCCLAPVKDGKVHFAISGSDAVEIALKTALLATRRPGVLAFTPGYHGTTMGSLAATSRPAFRDPFRSHIHSQIHHLPYAAPVVEVEEFIAGHSDLGAVLLEPVVGREGVLVPPRGWLSSVSKTCQACNVVLIADEIFTGFGRTGSLFAVEHDGVRPDLLCCGKALAGGLQIAAVVGRGDLMAAWATDGEALHANPLACAAALATLDVLQEQGLPLRAQRLDGLMGDRLLPLAAHPAVSEVRGLGLLWGVELDNPGLAKAWARGALERGVLALAGGPEGRVLQIVPPLTITRQQLSAALDILLACLPSPGNRS